MAYDDETKGGVGGLLLLLVVGLVFFKPLRMLAEAYGTWSIPAEEARALGYDLSAFQLLRSIGAGVKVAVLLYLAWRLCAVRRLETVSIVVGGFWVATIGLPSLEIALAVFVTGVPFRAMLNVSTPSLMAGLTFATLWTAYLLNSSRVANTYLPCDDAATEDVFT